MQIQSTRLASKDEPKIMLTVATGVHLGSGGPGTIAALAVTDSCAQHPFVPRLLGPHAAGRDLADAIHALCAVHGRANMIFETAARQRIPDVDHRWLDDAAAAIAAERGYLAALTAAVGPLPSTPGQAESDSAFAALRHAFDTLAGSDRLGCATGAAIALLIDWQTFRRICDTAAERVGLETPPCDLPGEVAIVRIGAAAGASPAVHRAMRFGAQQAFAQHRGLLCLIEARATARDRH